MSSESLEPLERLFHDPTRLAILSALLESPDAGSFTGLKAACGLTDGNLQSHLRALEAAGVVALRKEIHNDRARTRVEITDAGRVQFVNYLGALEAALRRAATAAGVAKSTRSSILSPDGLRAARGEA